MVYHLPFRLPREIHAANRQENIVDSDQNALRFAFSSFSFLNFRIIVIWELYWFPIHYLTKVCWMLYIYKISALCCFQCSWFTEELFSPANFLILTCLSNIVNTFFKVFSNFVSLHCPRAFSAANFLILPPLFFSVNSFFSFFIYYFNDLRTAYQHTHDLAKRSWLPHSHTWYTSSDDNAVRILNVNLYQNSLHNLPLYHIRLDYLVIYSFYQTKEPLILPIEERVNDSVRSNQK